MAEPAVQATGLISKAEAKTGAAKRTLVETESDKATTKEPRDVYVAATVLVHTSSKGAIGPVELA